MPPSAFPHYETIAIQLNKACSAIPPSPLIGRGSRRAWFEELSRTFSPVRAELPLQFRNCSEGEEYFDADPAIIIHHDGPPRGPTIKPAMPEN